MKKLFFTLMVVAILIGCGKHHIYHTYYGDIDIDTVDVAFFTGDSLPCYKVYTAERDSVEKAPGVWGYIEGPISYFYCPDKDIYFYQFRSNDEHGNCIVRHYPNDI